MSTLRTGSLRANAARPLWSTALFAATFAVLSLSTLLHQARAEESKLAEEDAACLKCHDKDGLEKKFEDGHTLSLRISTKAYLASVHKDNNCTDCHADLDDDTHGKIKTPLKSKRALTQAMQESCRDCHKKKFKQYDDSIHAVLVKAGSDKAPLCADCHNAHTQTPVAMAAAIDPTPCAACHEAISEAYAKDVHGLQRVARGKAAPICADCHQAHDVKAASLGDGPKDLCLACHERALEQHQAWLPNTGRHFESISCPACHAPSAQRRVNLRLYDGVTKNQLREKTGVPQFAQRAQAGDIGNLGLDERALWSLLTQFNQDDGPMNKVALRGRLEVRSGVEAHQMSEKSSATKDCNECHKEGAEPFQSVILSIAGSDGRPLRHPVRKDVLSSLTALESVRGFYAIGGTRIKLLDTLLLIVVAGSIGGPLAHMTIKRLFRGARRQSEGQARAAALAAASSAPDDSTSDHSAR